MEIDYKIMKDFDISMSIKLMISVDIAFWNYIVVYGTYNKKHFLSIPNWGIAIELGRPDQVDYNILKLQETVLDEEAVQEIAKMIHDKLQ